MEPASLLIKETPECGLNAQMHLFEKRRRSADYSLHYSQQIPGHTKLPSAKAGTRRRRGLGPNGGEDRSPMSRPKSDHCNIGNGVEPMTEDSANDLS